MTSFSHHCDVIVARKTTWYAYRTMTKFFRTLFFLIDDVMINVTSSRLRYGYERTIHAFWAASMGNGSCSSTFIDNFLKKKLCMTSQWTIADDVIRMTSLYDHYDVTTVFATTGNICPIRSALYVGHSYTIWWRHAKCDVIIFTLSLSNDGPCK